MPPPALERRLPGIRTGTERFTIEVLLPLGGLMALAVVVLLLIELWSAREQDQMAASNSVLLAQSALDTTRERIAAYVHENAVWDEAVTKLHDDFDAEWADQNLGTFLTGELSFGTTFVIDRDGRTMYGMVDGRRTDASVEASVGAGRVSLLNGARESIGGVSGVVSLGTRPALAAASIIRPHTEEGIKREPGWSMLVVADPIDTVLLSAMERSWLLHGLKVAVAVDDDLGAAAPLRTIDGEAVGRLTWRPQQPGRALLWRTLPVVAAVAVGLLSLTILVMRHAREAAATIALTRDQALRDPLTGLANRLLLHDRVEQALAMRQEHNLGPAILCLDLDGFKVVNDTHGHAVGDAVLVSVADRLRAAARASDTVARLGGDEFVVAQLGGQQPYAAEALAARLVEAIGAPFTINGVSLRIGVSVGVAVAPTDGVSVAELLRRGDVALYAAKRAGRGTSVTAATLLSGSMLATPSLADSGARS